MTAYFAPVALLGRLYEPAADVRIEVDAGRIADLSSGADATGAHRLGDLVVPGFANCHSHVFHRALRGRTQRAGAGSFWTWRDQMYDLAAGLDPDAFHRLAVGVYGEMAAAGISAVGEFHYLHHGPDGRPYADPNVMGAAAIEAAREVGLRITLLDTCYLSAGFGRPVEGVQRRFSDGDAAAWCQRTEALAAAYETVDGVVVGAAIHSVRAVPEDQLATVVAWAERRTAPLHVHVSEQPAENEECLTRTGRTPTALLVDHGALGPRTTAVHATHLSVADVTALGTAGTYAGFCPTTERELGDGIGPAPALRDAGCPLTLGSDSNAVIDPFEEMRLLELHERLASHRRGSWSSEQLLRAGCADGQRSLGFPDAGVLEVGARADLVAISYDALRLAGVPRDPDGVVHAASAADVVAVVVDGVPVAQPDAAGLRAAIDACWARA